MAAVAFCGISGTSACDMAGGAVALMPRDISQVPSDLVRSYFQPLEIRNGCAPDQVDNGLMTLGLA